MTDDPTLYRIAVFATPDDRTELASVLREQLNLLPTDAAIQARNLPGVLPERLPLAQAQRVSEGIREHGLHAEAFPANSIPELHPCETPHHLRWPAEGLQLCDLQGRVEHTIPWADIELVSLGQISTMAMGPGAIPPIVTVSAGGHPVPHRDTHSRHSSGLEILILSRNPRRVLRLDQKRLNYEFLGDRRSDSAANNIRLFLAELAQLAPGTYLTPATTAFLSHDVLSRYEFGSFEELERRTVLHALIRAKWRRETQTGR
jgi:hypothetical protein